jgi:hypothetical protein
MTSPAPGGTNLQEQLRTGIAPVLLSSIITGRMMLFLIPLVCLLPGCVGMSYHARDPVWGLGFSETRLAPDVWRRIRFWPCYNRRRPSRATGLFLTSISLVGGIVNVRNCRKVGEANRTVPHRRSRSRRAWPLGRISPMGAPIENCRLRVAAGCSCAEFCLWQTPPNGKETATQFYGKVTRLITS